MGEQLYWYKIYGNILCSQTEFPQLLTTEKRTADIDIVVTPLERKTPNLTDCFVDKVTREYIYFCNQVGVFEITDGRKIAIWPNPDVPLCKLTPFVLGYGIAMLFWQRGMHAIHCSAVEYDGKAVLIAGNSGAGKSTLTSNLLENGFRLLADDIAILTCKPDGTITVYPAYPQQKLCRDTALRNHLDLTKLWYIDEDKDKFALARHEKFCDSETILSGIVCLGIDKHGEQVSCGELTGHSKLISILENHFLFPMFRQNQVFSPEDMACCLHIAQAVPIYSITRPIGIDSTKVQMGYIRERILK